jgi:hypothetical protein
VIYDSNKEVLGCRDDPGFEAQFSNTYIIQVNQIYLEIGGNREARTTDLAEQEPMTFCHLHSLKRHEL